MKLLQVTEQNKPYYSADYTKGFNDGAKTQYEADKKEAERWGRWKQVGDDAYKCSACGEISCCKSLYCGDCGVRMEVE